MRQIAKIGILSLLMAQGISAQETSEAAISHALSKLGMLNIRIAVLPQQLIVGLESTRYRFVPNGLAKAIRAIRALPGHDADTLILVVHYRDLPILTIQSRGKDTSLYASWQTAHWERLLELEPVTRTSDWRLDIPIGPGLRYQLGNFDHPVRTALDILIGMNLNIRHGISVQGIMAVPVYNNFDNKKQLRVERLTVVVDKVLPGSLFCSMSAGFFSLNRLGAHLTGRKLLNDERWSLRCDLGFTGFSELAGPVSFVEKEKGLFPLYLAAAEYRWRRYDLNIRVTGGRFLYQDEGVALEIFRQMGEYRTGFFASKTSLGTNIGFNFSIPLAPRRYFPQGRVRISVAEQFPVSYRFRGSTRNALRYQPGNTLADQLYNYYPSFVVREILKR